MKRLIKYMVLIAATGILINNDEIIAQSGDTIWIPSGTAPLLDGIVSATEWNDASVTSIPQGDIMYKHTATHLYVAYTNSTIHYSTGIYIDKNHDGGSSPQTDDIWLHGSAGQYEFVGTGTSWQMLTPVGWAFVLNTSSEYMIPLSKLGLTTPGNYTLGILFCLNDWSINHTDEITWPSGGYPNCSNPSSWASAIITIPTDVNEYDIGNAEIRIWPNPTSGNLNVDLGRLYKEAEITVRNMLGQVVLSENFRETSLVNFDIKDAKGLYFLEIRTDKVEKLILRIMKE